MAKGTTLKAVPWAEYTLGVAGEDLVASIPLVRISDRIRIDVPLVGVPVAVDRPKLSCALSLPYPLRANTIAPLYFSWDVKSLGSGHRFSFVYKSDVTTLAQDMPGTTLGRQ